MTVDTYPDLFWAYTAVWTIVAVYVAWMGSRVARLERSLRDARNTPVSSAGCCDSKR
ncbi:MAG: CcmD family protein [Pseudomonadota bacterium]|jgi:CcmD family protein